MAGESFDKVIGSFSAQFQLREIEVAHWAALNRQRELSEYINGIELIDCEEEAVKGKIFREVKARLLASAYHTKTRMAMGRASAAL